MGTHCHPVPAFIQPRVIGAAADQDAPLPQEQLSLFSGEREDPETLEREKRRQKAILSIQKKYGKNALLKGMSLEEGATARERNGQIGGHKA